MNRKLISMILLMVSCCAGPGLAEAAGRSTVTFRDTDNRDRIYYFARGNNDHLVVNYWDGFAWQWADQGLPPGATAISHPSAITYKDTAGQQRIYVFSYSDIGSERNLVVNYWDGSRWQWANQGGDLEGTEEPTAVTYTDGYRRTYVFARRNDGHLAVNYWNGLAWVWADHGLPPGAVGVFPLDAVTYPDDDQRIYVFGKAVGPAFPNPRLVVNHRDGNGWHWTVLNAAGGGDVQEASAITYFDESLGHQRIYVFSTGGFSANSLWVTHWDGSWHFKDLGQPSQQSVRGPLSAISSVDENGIRRLQVFVSPLTHLVYEDCCVTGLYLWYTDSLGAHWSARGLPEPQWSGSLTPYVQKLDAIAYRSRSGSQWFHAFTLLDVSYGNYYLVRHYWGGAPVSLPSWAGQGPLP